jgi:predicted nucleic acid-binding protein
VPRRSYFLDASALAFKYVRLDGSEPRRIHARLTELFSHSANDGSDLQVPNICMAECAKAFARYCFEEHLYGGGVRAETAYRLLREALLKDVSRDRVLNSYELARPHFTDIEEIFSRDYDLPTRGQMKRLSSHDALIISMAREFALSRRGGLTGVLIVTCDKRIVEFCERYRGEYPRAIDLRTQGA